MVSYMLRAWWIGRKLPKLSAGIERPDVIIGSSVHLLAVLAAYLVAKRYKAKFIMEVRDLWPQTIIDMGQLSERSPITKVLQALERFLYRRAEKIITLQPSAHEYITACGIPRDKIVWIPNGVDLSRFDGAIRAKEQRAGFRVMYLGAHGQANALDVLLQAAKIVQERGLSEIEFILVGDGPEKPKLIELANDLGLGNVEFRDSVPKEEVPKVLDEADATVFILNDLALYRYGISLNKRRKSHLFLREILLTTLQKRLSVASPSRREIPRLWPTQLSNYLRCLKRSGKRWDVVGGSTWRSITRFPCWRISLNLASRKL
jgi:glycosyltransferase involved in cell wall biosynthesis